jgi:hypothetical protein
MILMKVFHLLVRTGPLLQDTTEFSYDRVQPETIGATHIIPNGIDIFGNLKRHTKCGIMMCSVVPCLIFGTSNALCAEHTTRIVTFALFSRIVRLTN